jgi:hypothetical protein
MFSRHAAAALYRSRARTRAQRQDHYHLFEIRWCAAALEFTCWSGEIVRKVRHTATPGRSSPGWQQ